MIGLTTLKLAVLFQILSAHRFEDVEFMIIFLEDDKGDADLGAKDIQIRDRPSVRNFFGFQNRMEDFLAVAKTFNPPKTEEKGRRAAHAMFFAR